MMETSFKASHNPNNGPGTSTRPWRLLHSFSATANQSLIGTSLTKGIRVNTMFMGTIA